MLLLPMIIGTRSFGQAITYEDFKAVIPFLQKEDFKGAFDQTNELLMSTQKDSSDIRGIVTYMNIFAAAGMVTLDQMSYSSFAKNANQYIGQYVVMSAHPCIDSSKYGFNSLQFNTNDSGKLQGMTITVNKTKTNIFFFEYFDYAEPVTPSELLGKNVRCGGVLQAVETNSNKSKTWVARLRIAAAFARDMAPR